MKKTTVIMALLLLLSTCAGCGAERVSVDISDGGSLTAQILNHLNICRHIFSVTLHGTVPAVIRAGQINGLPRRRDEKLQRGVVISHLVEYFAVQIQGPNSVLFIHKGQQTPELGQKFLLVNGGSPP